jgi:paraquat-inducible protein A
MTPRIDTALQVCEDCDTVYRRRSLARGEVARCVRCGAELERHHRLDADALLALVFTSMIAFVVANAWPIATLGLSGQHVSARLWGVIMTMWRDHAPIVATMAAATLFFIPALRMLLLGLVLTQARRRRRGAVFRRAMVALHYLRPWTMNEVFVLGTLVAIVKVRMYFEVPTDIGLYAYAALMMLITVFSGVDLRALWDQAGEPSS